MRYLPISSELFIENRSRFVKMLPHISVAIFYSNDNQPRNGDQYFPYRQQSDFFYLSGVNQEQSILLIAPDNKNKDLRVSLFLLKTNKQIATWEGHKYTKKEARILSGIENIYWLNDFDSVLKKVLKTAKDIFLNQNIDTNINQEVKDRNYRLGEILKKKLPSFNYISSAPLLIKSRLIKSDKEIALLRTACEITKKAFNRVLTTTKPNKFEFEIQADIEHEFTNNRANGHGYAPIIASGSNSCVLHYIDNDKKCQNGDLVLFDFGAEYANYSADMSRTIPVNGKFTNRQKDCYNAVLRTFKQAKKLYVVGNTINIINEKVNNMIEKEMINLGLFTNEDVQNQDSENPLFKKYFMHGTAHFLGLDVHDVGDKDEEFRPGMILTCEPGLYIINEKIGIRIENDILITNGIPIDLMEDIPIEIEDIEKLMLAK
jgi:Xaa-Pro aminopeptidase